MELRFNPTPDQTFELDGGAKYNFIRAKERIDELDRAGRYAEACEARYQGFQLLADALPEDEPMPLRWEHANSRAAIMILHGSTNIGRDPSTPANTQLPAIFPRRSAKNKADGLGTSASPNSVISNTPISSVAPNRFLTERKIRK